MNRWTLTPFASLLLWAGSVIGATPATPDRLIVAADGSGDCRTIQAAIDQAPEHLTRPLTVFIRKGTYAEIIRIPRTKPNLRLVGEDRHGVVIACTNNDKLHPGVAARAVLGIDAADCVVENLTVRNTTPYKGSQAEAVAINADRCILRHADFFSFQDTLNLNGRVYVADCAIAGDVDYVWGKGVAVFDRCSLKTLHDGYVVQARNDAEHDGFVFLDCHLTAAPETKKFYLARIETDRFPGSHVAFVRCSYPSALSSQAWLIKGERTPALRFDEYAATDVQGHPIDLSTHRFHRVLTPDQAAALTVPKLLGGPDAWDPTR